MAAIGPVCGFLAEAQSLSVFVQPNRATTLDPSDPQWVGAWWIPFVVTAALSIVFSLPLFFFPKTMEGGSKQIQLQQTKTLRMSGGILLANEDEEMPVVERHKLWKAFKLVMTNMVG